MLSKEEASAALAKERISPRKIIGRIPKSITGKARDFVEAVKKAYKTRDDDKQKELRGIAADKFEVMYEECEWAQIREAFDICFPGFGGYAEAAIRVIMPSQATRAQGRTMFDAGIPLRSSQPLSVLRARTVVWALIEFASRYPMNIRWLSKWWLVAWTFFSDRKAIAAIFAVILDEGGDLASELLEELRSSAMGDGLGIAEKMEVEIALFSATNSPPAWDFALSLLSEIKRQEGYAHAWMRALEKGSADALCYLFPRIVEEGITSRSGVAFPFLYFIRAFDVFEREDSESEIDAKAVLDKVLPLLRDPELARKQLQESIDPDSILLNAMALAFREYDTANELLIAKTRHSQAAVRFAALVTLNRLRASTVGEWLIPLFQDENDAVSFVAITLFGNMMTGLLDAEQKKRYCYHILDQLPRYSAKREKLVTPCFEDIEHASASIPFSIVQRILRNQDQIELLRHIEYVESYEICALQRSLQKTLPAKLPDWVLPKTIELIQSKLEAHVDLAGFLLRRMESVHGICESLEPELRRTSSLLQDIVTGTILRHPESERRESIERLLSNKIGNIRRSGLEMAIRLVEDEKCRDWAMATISAFVESRSRLTKAETALIEVWQSSHNKSPPEKPLDPLGLFAIEDRTSGVLPSKSSLRHEPISKHTFGLLKKAEAFASERRSEIVVLHQHGEDYEAELQRGMHFPLPFAESHHDTRQFSYGQNGAKMPFLEEFEGMWRQALKELDSDDGLEAYRALALILPDSWKQGAYSKDKVDAYLYHCDKHKIVRNKSEVKFYDALHAWLVWQIRLQPKSEGIDLILDVCDNLLAGYASKPSAWIDQSGWGFGWRDDRAYSKWFSILAEVYRIHPETFSDEQALRAWNAFKCYDSPPFEGRFDRLVCPCIDLILRARALGHASDADLFEAMTIDFQPYEVKTKTAHSAREERIGRRLRFRPDSVDPTIADFFKKVILQGLNPIANHRDRIHSFLNYARYSGGIEALVKALKMLGTKAFERRDHAFARKDSTDNVHASDVIRLSLPDKKRDIEELAKELESVGLKEKRLIELAVYAPQWGDIVGSILGVVGVRSSALWIRAHVKGEEWVGVKETREAIQREIDTFSDLSQLQRNEGMVDVAWFRRAYEAVGAKVWGELIKSAKYASSGGGYKRAVLYSDAMLKKIKKADLMTRINDKRDKEAVKALGLLPLAPAKGSATDLLRRYQRFQTFLKESLEFGAQRRASEKRAVEIGMENLARTAGYADPQRLQWAMEAKEIEDLKSGPIVLTFEETTVSLSIDELGEAHITVVKGEKTLKAVPAKLRKNKQVVALRARKKQIAAQRSRMKKSLEEGMCRGDSFTGADLSALFEHPVMRPLLERLIFVGEEGNAGYPDQGGQVLRRFDGALEAVGKEEKLRLAHAHDLYQGGAWRAWQHDCMKREILQPFKQVFRELYLLTEDEVGENQSSRRYGGYQVKPRQALGIFKSRGWLASHEEGLNRTFHDKGIYVNIDFLFDWGTPAEMEGITIEEIFFHRVGEWKPMPLADVPPLVFSEAMRDLDLVVSVAAASDVDPEASHSSVEMRQVLAEETLSLLGQMNVVFEGHFAKIKGEIASYHVHLGSGVCHVQPGGHLCIIPVHSQHRGRIFLPFADDDPKTAEILSKILLLADDKRIRDPSILSQIRRRSQS